MKSTAHFRFVVNDNQGNQSSVWRIWHNKNDIYFAIRPFAGVFKLSIHKSGEFNIALTKGFINENRIQITQRQLHQFKFKEQITEGLFRLLKLYILSDSLLPSSEKENSDINIITTDAESLLEFSLFISEINNDNYSDYISKSLQLKLLYYNTLANSKHYYLFYRSIHSVEPSQDIYNYYTSQSYSLINYYTYLRHLSIGKDGNGIMVFHDY
ncbi:MAG: hypothetical protein NT175_03430 [Bacteroidetes bacterium]|nr:hypothetical protein [Bacteroidota bacterium]